MRVLDLTKNFRSGFLKKKIRGINGVSFTVQKGEVFALLGHNGAGKTTTINCILDLIHPQAGVVEIFQKRNSDLKARSRVGYLPERPYFFEHLTGRELLLFYARLMGVESADQGRQIDLVLEKTAMTQAAGRPLRKYSKGMLQRIGLAQALLGDPDLLILDEPMSGLDPVGRREVRLLLQELKAAGKTIFLSSHIVPDVELLADKVGIMLEGHLVEFGALADLERQGSFEVRVQKENTPTGQEVISVGDSVELARYLERCHNNKDRVLSVDTRRTGLEEVFMKVHAQREEV